MLNKVKRKKEDLLFFHFEIDGWNLFMPLVNKKTISIAQYEMEQKKPHDTPNDVIH